MNILLIEDNADDIVWFKLVLPKGHELFVTDSVVQAKSLCLEKNIDFCFIDEILPRDSGLEFLMWAKTMVPTARTAMCSTCTTFPVVYTARSLRADYYLVKPLSAEQLAKILS